MLDYDCIKNYHYKAAGAKDLIKVEMYTKAKFLADVEIFSDRGLTKVQINHDGVVSICKSSQ